MSITGIIEDLKKSVNEIGLQTILLIILVFSDFTQIRLSRAFEEKQMPL